MAVENGLADIFDRRGGKMAGMKGPVNRQR